MLSTLLFAIGAVLRVIGTLAEPMWLDEAYSAYAAGKGWAFLWHVVPRYETHPPFYYSLLRGWSLVWGDSLPALRAFGMAAGIMTLPVAALAAYELGRLAEIPKARRPWLVFAAVALAALSPMLVEMSREVRPYPVMMLVYATALFAILRIGWRGRLGGPAYALYLAMLALMLWLHNLGPLYALSLGLGLIAMIIGRPFARRDWLLLIGGHALVALIWLPALLILLDQAPTWVSSTWLRFNPDGLWRRVLLLYTPLGAPQLVAAAILATAGFAVLARTAEGRRAGVMLALAALLPVALSITLSATIAPVFILRTMTPVAVPAMLIFAAGAAGLAGRLRWPALGAALLIGAQMLSIDARARESGPMQDWYGAVRWLQPRFRPGDVVYAYPNEGALPFDRAVRDLGLVMPSRAIPTPIPSLDPPPGSWYVSGSRGVPSLDRAHLRMIAEASGSVPTVWLLRLGPWAYDKGDVFLGELERDRADVGRWRAGPIDIIGLRLRAKSSGATPTARPAGPAAAAAAR